jgi:alcohol dehydrogenase
LVLERPRQLVIHDIPLPALGDDDALVPVEVLASGRYPFADLPRRCVGLDGADDLLAAMAGERGNPAPVHGVVTP